MDEQTRPSAQARQWAMLAHLLTLLGYLIGVGQFIPPLVIWLLKRDEDEFIGDQAKESLNFQITYLLFSIAAAVLVLVLIFTVILSCLGILLAWALGFALPIAHLVFVIIAGLKASDGVRYRYPLIVRFI